MYSRDSFKHFINNVIAPNVENEVGANMEDYKRVDPYGNFIVYFEECEGDFADSDRVRKYEPFGKMLIGCSKQDAEAGLGSMGSMDVHNYIKSINDVELNISDKSLEIPGLSYALHRLLPMSPNSNISMMWLNTRLPFVESLFLPWMQDNTMNGHFPLVKLDMFIEFPMLSVYGGKKIQYCYYGVRPIEIGMHKMTNEPVTEIYRKVSFDFDYFYVYTHNSNLINDSVIDLSSFEKFKAMPVEQAKRALRQRLKHLQYQQESYSRDAKALHAAFVDEVAKRFESRLNDSRQRVRLQAGAELQQATREGWKTSGAERRAWDAEQAAIRQVHSLQGEINQTMRELDRLEGR